MNDNKQAKALLWIAGLIILLIAFGFSYRKYIEMRIAGVSGGDALLFMLMAFIGIILVMSILVGFALYYLIPEGTAIYSGIRKIIHRKKAVIIEDEVNDSSEIKTNDNDEFIRLKEEEIKIQQEKCITELIAYASGTFKKFLTPDQINGLARNIRKFLNNDENYEPVDSSKFEGVTSLDLFHFGWNIGKRIITSKSTRKMGEETAIFLKGTFPHSLKDVTIDTIKSKLTNDDGKFTLPRLHPGHDIAPHVFPIV